MFPLSTYRLFAYTGKIILSKANGTAETMAVDCVSTAAGASRHLCYGCRWFSAAHLGDYLGMGHHSANLCRLALAAGALDQTP